jgi:hypothetical protein
MTDEMLSVASSVLSVLHLLFNFLSSGFENSKTVSKCLCLLAGSLES